MTSLVPTVLQSVDVRQFRTVLIGGAQASGVLPPNVVTTYGLTETMGGVVYNEEPLDQVEIRISTDTEIQIKSPTLFRCYRDGTDAQIKSGWFHTGDIGELVDGRFLKITDRKKEMFKTAGGKYVAPQMLENKYKESIFIEQIMVLGENRKFPSALIVPNFETLKNWAGRKGITFNSNEEMIKNELKKWLINPIVDIKVLNKEIIVLGEVRNPNTVAIDKDHVSLLEMISKTGGFEFYANLKLIKINQK